MFLLNLAKETLISSAPRRYCIRSEIVS